MPMGRGLSRRQRHEILRALLLLGATASVTGGAAVVPTGSGSGLGGRLQEVAKAMQDTAAPGALGRFASVLVLHPLDTLKTRAQVVSSVSRRTAETAIYRSPGVLSGAGPAVAGQIVNAMLTCAGYELWKGWSRDFAPVRAAMSSLRALCGSCAAVFFDALGARGSLSSARSVEPADAAAAHTSHVDAAWIDRLCVWHRVSMHAHGLCCVQ